MKKKIKVLIIDDSALIRQLLQEILSKDPAIEVVGTASDPLIARDKIKQLLPDVLTLDIEMPKMDGITFLKNLMRLRPMPVVMISTLTEAGADVTLEALEIGAIDFISKPKVDVSEKLQEYASDIINKIKIASVARVRSYSPDDGVTSVTEKHSADVILAKDSKSVKNARKFSANNETIIAIGSSTGGTEAIKEVLIKMPANAPAIVISQHIPAAFSAPFAKRMNGSTAMTVYEAKDGQQILPGCVYIAPGSYHLLVEKSGSRYVCRLNDGPKVNRHKPSVDVMFRSVCQNVGPNAVAAILTGMGDDGARGMKEMHEIGSSTIAQDEKTSVVWGMPGEAVKHGGVDHILPLDQIADKLLALCE
ncbi:protein-glutamate methylesterase/protein-glutamine glutaminase [sulfur-oxidizing endosymbiont of Gigantopelta aegis]|uniref:protein-glutamate methylesterase/protein-glutamine glutaminase n=1 Tax=sulfur-oxidizing endosymbiont of Gigantopelta aegis TaxID=2794934 RepID=UPI0018DC03EA|nr:chemotaxis response regulator protein-glutamate methylesterase [sulfur-oxidizing endosymbiont of Gigantopelta aegis]